MAIYGDYAGEGVFEVTLSANDMALVTRAAQFAEGVFSLGKAERTALRRFTDIYLSAPDEDIIAWTMAEEDGHGHKPEEMADVERKIRGWLTLARENWSKYREEF